MPSKEIYVLEQMSTSDMTEYLRVKMAERGTANGAKFMEDGFDRWAESERPARSGQVEKIPAESKMKSYGGAMSLSQAKKMQAMMMGGAMVNVAGFNVDVPDLVIDAVKQAKRLQAFIATLDSRLPAIVEETRDNIILKPDDYSPQYIAKAQDMIGYMQALKGYTTVLKNVLAFVQYIPTGSGKPSRSGYTRVRFGGAATTLQKVTEWINYVKKKGEEIYNYVKWFAQNAAVVKDILKLDASQPEGQQIIDALGPIWDLLGVVAGKGRSCQCKGGKKSLPILDVNTMTMQRGPKRGGMKYLGHTSDAMGGEQELRYETSDYKGTVPTNESFEFSAAGRKRGGMRYQAPPETYGTYESNYMGPSVGTAPMRPGALRPVGGMRYQAPPETYGTYESNYMGPSMGTAPKRPSAMRVVGGASCGGRKPSARGEIVKKVMREQGLSLPQASKYVKERGLY